VTLKKVLLVTGIVLLAPVVIVVIDRRWDSLWVIPAGLLPIALFAEKWPSPWSFLTLALFGILLAATWRVVRRSTPQDRWRGVRGLALLALAGPVALIGISVLLLQARLWVPSWLGAASVAWSVLLLFLTRGVAPESQAIVWLLRLWIAFTLFVGVNGFLYGSLVGLCC
jgi:hypothetical protein